MSQSVCLLQFWISIEFHNGYVWAHSDWPIREQGVNMKGLADQSGFFIWISPWLDIGSFLQKNVLILIDQSESRKWLCPHWLTNQNFWAISPCRVIKGESHLLICQSDDLSDYLWLHLSYFNLFGGYEHICACSKARSKYKYAIIRVGKHDDPLQIPRT